MADHNEQQQTELPIPDPTKLTPGALSMKHKRWIFLGVMAVLALIVLGNILTGPKAPLPTKATDQATAKQQQQNPTPAQLAEWQANLKSAEEQLKQADQQRQQAKQQMLAATGQAPTAADLYAAQTGQDPRLGASTQAQPSEAEQQKAQFKAEQEALAYKSLFADNLVRQERAGQTQNQAPAHSEDDVAAQPSTAGPVAPAALQTTTDSVQESRLKNVSEPGKPASGERKPLDFIPGKQPTFWLPEGTVIEAVLTNKLDGDDAGPVNVMISGSVYLPGTRLLLIPQGARVLGEASKVSSFGQQRLAVTFHRIIVPGLQTYSIPLDEQMPGLAQGGEVGLRGKVNSHYASIFGASLAVGAIGGLAQIGNSTGAYGYSPMSEFRNGVSQSTAQSADRILDRFLNRMPTIAIPEGTRVRVLLTDDLQLPSYASMHTGGSL